MERQIRQDGRDILNALSVFELSYVLFYHSACYVLWSDVLFNE